MLNENTIEQSLITYYYGPDIAPYSDNPQRENFTSVILESHLKESLKKLNPGIPETVLAEA